ncbi:hypothetical protein K4K61_003284 [Colletotrichum sp. SAR11_59]|nr:hypothetical protein K4K61_003284 [Colletotrichum sp. SAR11_59]
MEQVHRILAELSGESRDLALRRALEETARDHLIGLLMHEDYDRVTQWYTDDVTMVLGLDTTLDGEILKGHEEIVEHFVNLQQQTEIVVVPILTIADRGRITVYTESYYKWLGKSEQADSLFVDEPVEAPFVGWPEVSYGDVLKMREVVVFDLDEHTKVKRVDWRLIGMDHLGQASLDALALQTSSCPKRIMSPRNQHDRFQVFADELTGDSRDRPLRYEIENKISIFFDDINEKRWTSVNGYFNDDARVIFGFRSPNQIIDKDVDLVIERIREKTDGMRRVTVPTLVLVDRGRVTCFLTNLWIDIDGRDDDATLDLVEADTLFGEMHEVAIIDLDDEYRFKRVEQNFDDYAQELASASKDRLMRPAIEQMVRQYFRAADEKKWDTIMEFFGTHPTFIGGLKEPGWIFRGRDDVLSHFKTWTSVIERTIPKIIIVDRGRVTCHLVAFYQNPDHVGSGHFQEFHSVAIMDLDVKNRIMRMEYRDIDEEITVYEGGKDDVEASAKEAVESIVRINYLS